MVICPKQILIHSFITGAGGQKMSKTLGNVVDPFELINQYGLESVRYYLLSQIPIDNDGEFTIERFREIYNADLANGLGNLVARVAKLCEKVNLNAPELPTGFDPKMTVYLASFKFNEALNHIWGEITEADKKVNEEKPWELSGKNLEKVLVELVKRIQHIAFNLQPFLPETAEKILKQFSGQIKSQAPLFPRLR